MTNAKVAAARSQVQVIQAKADSAKANIDVVARSRGAQAVVQETQIPLHDTELKSPLNGVVLQKSIEKGTLVSSGDKAFVVADASSVKAVFAVADTAVAEMKLGAKLSVESESMPGKEFQGQITSVFPAADSKSRAFNVEVTIANPEYLLRPNMIVSLRVGTQQAKTAQLVVPLNAVIKSKSNANGRNRSKSGIRATFTRSAPGYSTCEADHRNDLVKGFGDRQIAASKTLCRGRDLGSAWQRIHLAADRWTEKVQQWIVLVKSGSSGFQTNVMAPPIH